MTFSEANSVRDLIRDRLVEASSGWMFTAGPALPRKDTDVLIKPLLRDALLRLNPMLAAEPHRADEVIYELRALTLAAGSVGLVRANEDFRRWLLGEHSRPFGPERRHQTVRLVDFEDLSRNTYVLSTEVTFRVGPVERRFDLVLWVNGIPMVVGEAKTATRPGVSWLDGAVQIHEGYEGDVPDFFVPNAFSFATDGRDLRYGAVRAPDESWFPWRSEGCDGPLDSVGRAACELLSPTTLLDIVKHFTVYGTDGRHQKIKVISRQPQYRAGNKIVDRVLAGRPRKGLIWHFQGSGKSLLMLFTAQKLRNHPWLGSPTVLIVVDRIDLDTQITSTFNASDVPNVETATSGAELRDWLGSGQRKIIITTVFKFADADPELSDRDDIVCLVDEAHRTQEGDLGDRMRASLPHAFFFGMTGTPINRTDRNTFRNFGAQEDPGRYLDRYPQSESIADDATLPIHFEPRGTEFTLDPEEIDREFDRLAGTLNEEETKLLTKRTVRMERLFKSSERIRLVCADVVRHFTEHVAAKGFKAQVVVYDKETCGLYKAELDRLIGEDASAVVISKGQGTPGSVQPHLRSKLEEERLLDRFRDPDDPLQIIIVTAKLLTGFDAPILQTMYLDKVMKDHTLLQAICRTNRPYTLGDQEKTHGTVVDYIGVFRHLDRALQFDEAKMQETLTSIRALAAELPAALNACLAFFPGVDRNVEGHDGLVEAQRRLSDLTVRDLFGLEYVRLQRLWEALSPDPELAPYRDDYTWLTQVYQSVKPRDTTGRRVWRRLGAQTRALIDQHLHVDAIRDDLETLVLDAAVAEAMEGAPEQHIDRVQASIGARLRLRAGNPRFASIGERLEALRREYENGQITSLLCLKRLLDLAREIVTLERTIDNDEAGKEALTALFERVHQDRSAPERVGRIVWEIDDIVRSVRWENWQRTGLGDRRVRQALRGVLLKYNLHRDDELFEKAYDYIRQYY
ncbi:type I restriction endonuclease subunit R [Actinomadura violacea]|uniref:Type I restriction enzyme endonuclease subunit n=1 Tax=Actinomadura violacea TaxID=2819934 RepID=A0ABS3S7R7_9ACTN|nr:HsdR family type I site-specific deoxyribonuclease [Actinomadura violacea]MBO2465047.1 HsdR family type I site-specific deoxyribonuclease [Actinomadura violacea]